jgi:GNAT superfamily N-acetyltransferase
VASLSLRAGRRDDAETLYKIHRGSVLVAYAQIFPPDRYPFPETEMRSHWIQRLGEADAATVIAELETLPVGFVVVSPGWLESMFVLPSEWGRGVGSALHDQAVELLRAKGAGGRLWVLERNEAAAVLPASRLASRRSTTAVALSAPPVRPPVRARARRRVGPIPNPHPPTRISRVAGSLSRLRASFEPDSSQEWR